MSENQPSEIASKNQRAHAEIQAFGAAAAGYAAVLGSGATLRAFVDAVRLPNVRDLAELEAARQLLETAQGELRDGLRHAFVTLITRAMQAARGLDVDLSPELRGLGELWSRQSPRERPSE